MFIEQFIEQFIAGMQWNFVSLILQGHPGQSSKPIFEFKNCLWLSACSQGYTIWPMTLGPDARDITQYSPKNDKNRQGF